MRILILHLLVYLHLPLAAVYAQPISVTGVGVTGRFNTCTGSNLPFVTAQLISTGGGSAVSGGLFTCINPCDSSTIRVTLSNVRWNKNPNSEWLHGLFLPVNAGFSVSAVSIPAGFIAYNAGCVGTCPSGSGLNGGPGFYFDNTNGNSCCPGIFANDGLPCNNYGDVTIGCSTPMSLTFDITFCNSLITSSSYQFIFTGSSDGETGCYNFNDLLSHHVTFTIPTVPCSPFAMNLSAGAPQRICTAGTENYVSTLSGNCAGNNIYWWDAATGGNLLGTGSPFVYDPPGNGCPSGTTLYATCCANANLTCVQRMPVTIPGNCIPLQIDSVQVIEPICNNPAVISGISVSGASSALTYTLNPGSVVNTTGVFPNLNLSSYTVTMTDAGNCSISTQVNFNQPVPLSLTFTLLQQPTCSNPNAGSLSASGSGGTGSLLYSIQPAAIQSSPGIFTGLSAQTYTLTITDSQGCTLSQILQIAAPVLPDIVSLSWLPPACSGDSNGQVTVLATGVGPLTYTLLPLSLSDTSGNFTSLSAGNFTVQVQDTLGCVDLQSFSLADPPLLQWQNVVTTSLTCSYLQNGSIQASATGGTGTRLYMLQPLGLSNTSGQFNNLPAGNYTLSVTDSLGCMGDTVLSVNQPAALQWISGMVQHPLCSADTNGSILVGASGGTGNLSYVLFPSGVSNNTGVFNSLSAGNYTVQVSDAQGCQTISSFILQQPAPILVNTWLTNTPACFGDSTGSLQVLASGGTGGIQFQLIPTGLISPTGLFTGLAAGTYTLTMRDSNQCTLDTIWQLNQPAALSWLNQTISTPSCYSQTNGHIHVTAAGGSGPLLYTLHPGSINSTNGLFNNLPAGSYTVLTTDSLGCNLSANLLITQPDSLQWLTVQVQAVSCYAYSNGQINVQANGGTGLLNYTLQPGSISNTSGAFTGLSAGTYTLIVSDANACSIMTQCVLTQPAALSLDSITQISPSCIPGNDGQLSVFVQGGTSPFSFSLSGGPTQSSPVWQNLAAGIYSIQVTDALLCSLGFTYTLTTPLAPIINSIQTDSLLCFADQSGSINMNASGGTGSLQFTLLPPGITQSSQVFNSLAAGVYTVIVQDSLGCQSVSTTQVYQPQLLQWASLLPQTPSCYGGQNGSLQVAASGGSGTLMYSMLPGSVSVVTGSFINLGAASYTLVVADQNGCQQDTIYQLTQPDSLLWIQSLTTSVSCYGGNNGIIQVTASGGTGTKLYQIQPGGITNTSGVFNGLSAGTYTVQVTDSLSCSLTLQLTIQQASALQIDTLIVQIPSCVPGQDGSILIQASGGSAPLQYSIGSGWQSSPFFNALSSGVYTVQVMDTALCLKQQVVALNNPNSPLIQVAGFQSPSCFSLNNGFIQVTASGGTGNYTYQLLPGLLMNTSGNFNNLTAGIYTLQVSDSLGCSHQITQTLSDPPLLQWTNLLTLSPACTGSGNGQIQGQAIGGTGQLQYTLLPTGQTNVTGIFNTLFAGTYTLNVADSIGCVSDTVLTLTNPAPLQWTNVSSDSVSCFGTSSGAIQVLAGGGSGVITYQIIPGGTLNTSGQFTGLVSANYTISVTDAQGCSLNTQVFIGQPLALVLDSINSIGPSCIPGNNGSIQVNASGGTAPYSYFLGSTVQLSAVFNGLTAGAYTVGVIDVKGCILSQAANLVLPNAPQIVSVSSTAESCQPGQDAVLTLVAGAGQAPYSYQVNSGMFQTSPVFISLSAGNYTITISDALGCTQSGTHTISGLPSPIINQTVNTPASCQPGCDGEIQILASGGTGVLNYSLDGVNYVASNVWQALCAGTYTVFVKDGAGCTDSQQTILATSNGPLFSTTIVNPVTCFGLQNGSLLTGASGGTGTLQFTLLPSGISNTTGVFTNLAAGIYTLVASDQQGCTQAQINAITEPTPMVWDSLHVQNPTCTLTNNGTIDIFFSGGTGPFQYSMNPSAVFQAPSQFGGLGGGISYTLQITDTLGCLLDTTFTLSQPAGINWQNLQITPVSCGLAADGQLQVLANGGTGLLSYQLSPVGISNQTGLFTALPGGSYTITVSDSNACSRDTMIFINEPPALQWQTLQSSSVSCTNGMDGSITCLASGGSGILTYQLQPGLLINTNGIFTSLAAGSYTIMVSDTAGCFIDTFINLNNPPALIWNQILVQAVSCFGLNNGIIDAEAIGGTGVLQYTLLPTGITNTTGMFAGLIPGAYTLLVQDSLNCNRDTIIILNQPPSLQLNVITIQNVNCYNGTTGEIQVLGSGGVPNYQYTLLPGSLLNGSGQFMNLSSGLYTIILTDAFGCSTTLGPLIVSQPAPLSWNTSQIFPVNCFGDSSGIVQVNAQGGTGTLTYTLQPAVGLSGGVGVYTQLPAGVYTITVSDANNCTINTQVSISQNPEINFSRLDWKPPTCAGDKDGFLWAEAQGGVSPWSWIFNGSLPQSSGQYTSLQGGVYTLQVIDALGCSRDTVLNLPDPLPLTLNAVNIQEVSCDGFQNGSIQVQASGGTGTIRYQLFPGSLFSLNGLFTPLASGTYLLVIEDSMRCRIDTNLIIPDPVDTMRIGFDKQDPDCKENRYGWAEAIVTGGKAPYQYRWSTIPIQQTARIENLNYGTYAVTVYDAAGCEASAEVKIKPSDCCTDLFLPNAFSPNGDGLNDQFQVQTAATIDQVNFQIYDRWGNKVWQTNSLSDAWDGTYKSEKTGNFIFFYLLSYRCVSDGNRYQKKGDVMVIR